MMKQIFYVVATVAMFVTSQGSAQNVGIGTTDPSSTLQVSGSFAGGVRRGIAGYTTPLATDYLVTNIDPSPAAYVLPAPSTCPGRTLYFASGSAVIVIYPSVGFISIPGNSTGATNTTVAINGRAQLISDGINWLRMY